MNTYKKALLTFAIVLSFNYVNSQTGPSINQEPKKTTKVNLLTPNKKVSSANLLKPSDVVIPQITSSTRSKKIFSQLKAFNKGEVYNALFLMRPKTYNV